MRCEDAGSLGIGISATEDEAAPRPGAFDGTRLISIRVPSPSASSDVAPSWGASAGARRHAESCARGPQDFRCRAGSAVRAGPLDTATTCHATRGEKLDAAPRPTAPLVSVSCPNVAHATIACVAAPSVTTLARRSRAAGLHGAVLTGWTGRRARVLRTPRRRCRPPRSAAPPMRLPQRRPSVPADLFERIATTTAPTVTSVQPARLTRPLPIDLRRRRRPFGITTILTTLSSSSVKRTTKSR